MYPFFESIRVKDGFPQNLDYHQERMDRTSSFHDLNRIDLYNKIQHIKLPPKGVYKLRVSYLNNILDVKIEPYQIKPIHSLKLVECPDIQYSHKSEDRTILKNLFNQRGISDDILITVRGHITDTSYGSIIFFKNNHWFTPKSYLLKGTMVSHLVTIGEVELTDIIVGNIHKYSHFKVVNAMRPPSEIEAQCITNITF